MQELINKLTTSGLSNEQAVKAAEIFKAYLKDKMPYIMHQHIDSMMDGNTLSEAFKKQFQDLANETEENLKDFRSRAEVMMKDMSEKFKNMWEKKS